MDLQDSDNIQKYNAIMARYRAGEFGDDYLTLAEILKRANEPHLLEKMSISELQYLKYQSTGLLKLLFKKLEEKKLGKENTANLAKTLTKNK